MVRFARSGFVGAVLLVAMAACSGSSLSGPFAFGPATVIAALIRNGSTIDAGVNPTVVEIVMVYPAFTCAQAKTSVPSRTRSLGLLLLNSVDGFSAGNSYPLGGSPFSSQFGLASMLDIPAGSISTSSNTTTLASYNSGQVTFETIEPTMVEGTFDINGTSSANGEAVNLKGVFSTATICSP